MFDRWKRARARWFLLGVLVCSLSAAERAHADGVADEAEADFRMAVARFQQRDYEGALAWFMASNRLAPNANVQFNVARTFDALGRLPEAHRWYEDALHSAADEQLRTEVTAALQNLEARVALVEVTTDPPGATVYLDRRDLGSIARSPARIAVPPGSHRVLVELPGYADPQPIEIEATIGRTVQTRFALARIVGRVGVQGEAGTEVRVDRDDGEPACIVPCELELPPGVHTLRGSREGRRFDPLTITVDAGRRTGIRIEGRARVGSLVVTTDERDATVEVDGRPMGFTPAVMSNVPVGERAVRVTLDGFEPIERTVTVSEGEQAELRDLRLTPVRTVTTASRVAESYEASPASLSVISAQELAAFRYPTIASALRGQRGVSITYDTAYHSISIRGIGQANDYGNRLLVLQDGAILNDNILYQSYVGFDGRTDLGDVNRIELVRGPGSVLYGTGAVSGLVNLIQNASDRPTGGDVTISAASSTVGRGRGHLHVRLPGGGGIDASVSGAYGDGRSLTLSPRDGSPDVTVSGVDRFTGVSSVGRVAYRDLRAQWMVTQRRQIMPAGPYGALLGNPGTYYTDRRIMGEVRYEPHLGERSQLFLRLVGNGYGFWSDALSGDPAAPDRSQERYQGAWMVGEARLVTRPVDALQLTVGGEVSASVRASIRGTDVGTSTPYVDVSNRYQIFSAYALAEYKPADWLRLSAGLRADVWRTETVDFDPPFAISPRLAAIFRLREGGFLKLMGGRAFRAPSTYELTYNDGGLTQVAAPNGSLAPESIWSAEAEYSQRFRDDWVALASVYYQRARSFIGTEPDSTDPSLFVYANAGQHLRTLGGDVEIRKEWRDGWMMSAMYGYLDARYESLPANAMTSSTLIPNQPHHFASARSVVPMGRSGVDLAVRTTLEARRRIDLESDARTLAGCIVDVVLTGQGFDDHLDWSFGVYDLFGWQRQLPVGDNFPARTLAQPGRSVFAHISFGF